MGQEGQHSQFTEEDAEASGDPACHWHAQSPCSVFLDSLSGALLLVHALIPDIPVCAVGYSPMTDPVAPPWGTEPGGGEEGLHSRMETDKGCQRNGNSEALASSLGVGSRAGFLEAVALPEM